LVDPKYPIESIITDFNKHIHETWNREEVMESLLEYDKNILVYLNEYLYAKEHGLSFDFIPEKVNVEHIMPASGHNIDSVRDDAGMTKEEFEGMVNLLGNKILLEEDINKHIGMDWFKNKKGKLISEKNGYQGSHFGIASSLSLYPSDRWGKEDIEKANLKVATRICDFIFNESYKK
jgi:reverse gyrase